MPLNASNFIALFTHPVPSPAFIIKQNSKMFPKEVLYAVLKAHHPHQPVGHWVAMKSNITGVDLFTLVYAWSQSSVAYMVSTCSKTIHPIKDYYAKFSNGYNNKETCAYPRPAIAHQTWHFFH